MMAEVHNVFGVEKGFCCNCGTILPLLGNTEKVQCYTCKSEFTSEAFGTMENHYEINFHSRNDYLKEDIYSTSEKSSNANKSAGPIVERKCPKCGNDTMSYATLQLRSADEGQTVFYTCTKCSYKETENS